MKTLAAAITLTLTGCAVMPDTVRIEGQHTSHASQHFGSNATAYGHDVASIVAHWGKPSGLFLELGEGIALDKRTEYRGECQIGAMMGPRETFTGRIGYTFKLKD